MTESQLPLTDPILIVEDDAGTAMLLKNHLEGAGWGVAIVSSGQAAIHWLAQHRASLVLLDNSLPDMTGEELIAATELPPFIVTTGAGSERLAVALMKLGARDYLVKDSLFLHSLRPAVKRVLHELETERRLAQAEDALRQSEAMYRMMAENIKDIITRQDRTGRFLYVSPSARSVFGYEPAEILGKSPLDLIHPEDLEEASRAFEGMLEDKLPRVFSARHRAKDGSYRWLEVDVTPIVDPVAGEVSELLASSRDISSRMQTEQQLAQSEARFRTLTELSPVGVYMSDVQGQCQYVNERWCQMTGLDPGEAKGAGWMEMVHPEDREQVAQEWARTVAEGRDWRQEFRLVRKDGTVRWAYDRAQAIRDEQGRIMGFIGANSDVTSLKEAQVALLDSEARNRALLDAIPDLLFVNGPGGAFLDYHVPEGASLAFPPEQFLGRSYRDLFPDLADLFEETHARAQEDGRPVDFDYRLTLGTETRTFEGRKVAFHSDRVLTMVRDVTEKRNLERALLESQERLSLALEAADLGIWEWRSSTDLLEYDARYNAILGHPAVPTSMPMEQWKALVHPEDWPGVDAVLQDQLAGRIPIYETEYRRRAADGRWIWIHDRGRVVARDAEGHPLRAAGTIQDVTEGKRAKEAMKESEERFRALATMAPAGIYLTSPEGQCVYGNPRWCAMAGLDPEEALGDGWVQGIHPDDREVVFSAWQRMVDSEGSWGMEYRFQAKDGKVTWVHGVAASLRDPAGKILGYVGINQDITERKHAEAIILRQQRNLAHAARLADMGHWTWGGGTGGLQWSPHLRQLMGVEPKEDATEERFFGLLHPEDREHVQQSLASALRGEREYDVEFRLLRPDGRLIHAHAIAEITFDHSGQPLSMLGMFQDITDRKLTEALLQSSEARARSLYHMVRLLCDNVPDLIWAKDLDRRFLFVNKAMCETLLGASDTEEPLGKDALFFATRERQAHPDNLEWHTFGENCVDSDALVLAHQAAGRFEESGYIRGEKLYLDVSKAPFRNENGVMIGTVGCGRVLTHEKFLERQRQLSEEGRMEAMERLRIVADNLPIVIAFVDADGRFLFANREYERWCGKSLDQILGATVAEVVGEEASRAWAPRIAAVMAGREVYWEDEWMLPEGCTRTYEAHYVPYRDAEGRVAGYFVLAQDITDRKRVEDADRETGKLQAKARMAAYIAHEINNPIGGIKNAFLLIRDTIPSDHPHHVYVDMIMREIDRIAGIVRTMYHAYRTDPAVIVEASLDVAFSDLVALLGPKCRQNGVALRIRLPEQPPKGRMAEGLIRQVLFNLLLNASEASPNGGIVTMSAQSQGDDLLIEVADEGIGIAPEIQDRIFKPDFTTKRDTAMSGLGMGLATCKRLVESLGGSLRFGPNLDAGKGTVFTIHLPFGTSMR